MKTLSRADAETLLFAAEKAAKVLADEKALSNLARMFGLRTWNIWTVQLESLGKGHVQVSDIELAIKELGEKRHKLKQEQSERILEAAMHIACKQKGKRTDSTL